MGTEQGSYVVTGASGNLGQAVASLLLERGARVATFDRDARKSNELFAQAIAAKRVIPYALDLTSEAAVNEALRDADARLGGLAGVVCTVGGYKGGAPIAGAGLADWDAMWSVNVRATVTVTSAALPLLVGRERGAIVHVASLAALSGTKGQAAYSAAKAAVLRLTEAAADEVKASGVRVNAVLPGTLDTPQNRAWMSEADAAIAIDPGAVAEVVAFLLSDAARAVTGAAIRVTGQQ